MKTIALLRGNPKSSGLVRILTFLSSHYLMDCYIWDRQGDYRPVIQRDTIRYIRCSLRSGFYSLGTLFKLLFFQFWLCVKLSCGSMDAIHAFDLPVGLVGLCVARLKRIPFVYHCLDPYHATLPERWPKIFAWCALKLENIVINGADSFIITDKRRMAQHPGAEPRKIIEIANVPMLSGEQGEEATKEAGFRTGFIGSLTTGRDLQTMIHAVGSLEKKGVTAVIAGFGPLEDEIRLLAQNYRNIEHYDWLPYDQVLKLEQKFDLFLVLLDKTHPGYAWGSSNKLFEAMYFAKPIITCEGTLTAQQVQEIGNGLIIPYGDVDALQEALLFVKEHPEEAAAMGRKGRDEFERNWAPGIMQGRLLEVYKALLTPDGCGS